jgi:hypothetical protein
MRAAVLPPILALALGVLSACSEPQPKNTSFLVSPASSEFYKYGPAQAFGADFALKRGDRVTMLRREFGFSQVRMEDGTTGYMATEDLKPAPTPPPVARTRSSSGARHVASRGSNVKPTPGDPLFDVTDIPLPLPNEPEKKPSKQ